MKLVRAIVVGSLLAGLVLTPRRSAAAVLFNPSIIQLFKQPASMARVSLFSTRPRFLVGFRAAPPVPPRYIAYILGAA